jgi:hypothetical protein
MRILLQFYGTKWESFVGLAATSDSIYDRWFFVPKSKAMMRVDIAPQPHHHNFSFDPQVQHGQIIRHSQLSQLQLPQQQQYYYSTTMQQRHALQQEQQLVLQSPAQPTLSHFRYQQQYSQRQTQLAQQVTVVQQQQQQICSVAQSAHTYLPLPPPGHGGTTAFDCTQQHTANLGAQGQQHNYGGVGQSQMWGEHQPQHDTFAQPVLIFLVKKRNTMLVG